MDRFKFLPPSLQAACLALAALVTVAIIGTALGGLTSTARSGPYADDVLATVQVQQVVITGHRAG